MTRAAPARDALDAGDARIAFRSATGRWVLLVAALGSGMAFLDGTVVNVALPAIGRDLHASTSALQWVLDGYLLTLASLILLGGSLGDRHGRRRVFRVGVGVFTLSSLLCALAPTAGALVAARLAQGVGGALLTPGSLAMIESSLISEDRPRAIGAWSGLAGTASALGPLLGGWLIAAFSWRAVFLINVPIGAFVALAAGRVPESRDPAAPRRLDGGGAALASVGLAGSTYALIEGPRAGLTAPVVVAGCAGVLGLIAFLALERRVPSPMLPLQVFSSRQFSAANLVTFAVYAALGGVFFMLVAFLQISLRYSPIASGAASIPVTVLMLALSPASGALAQRIGPRIPLTIGPIVIAAGMLLMAQIQPGDSYLTGVLPSVLVFGVGLTLVVSPVTATVLAALPSRNAGIASGVNNAAARVASLLAVAVLPLIAGLGGHSFYDPQAMTSGFHVAMIACAGLALAGGALAWLTIDAGALSSQTREAVEALPASADFSCGAPATPPQLLADGERSRQ